MAEEPGDSESSATPHACEPASRTTVYDFLVDILGGLVPGALLTVGMALALVPAIRAVLAGSSIRMDLRAFSEVLKEALAATRDTPTMVWAAFFVFVVVLAYVLGHLYYRRDPKLPDRASVRRLLRVERQAGRVNSDEEAVEWLKCNAGCSSEDEVQFPYEYLDTYLNARGHAHLVRLVHWVQDRTNRSKTHINLLKIRLEFHCPNHRRQIVRNEAHVRLATSVWYVSRSLRKAGLISASLIVICCAVVGIRGHFDGVAAAFEWCIPLMISPLLVLACASYSQGSIEKFIHYQRMREAFYVLEVAYTAFRNCPELLLSPPVRLKAPAVPT